MRLQRCERLARSGLHRGATLVVALVLLLVMTVIGVSGMNTATMEIAMAGNVELEHDAFRLAETAIDTVVASGEYAVDAPRTLEWLGGVDYDRRAVTTYRGATVVPDAAFSADAVAAFHFDIEAVGRAPRNARSEHVQSFYVVGPAP